jgi:hypothetical protein
MSTTSPADGRLAIFRSVQRFFVDALGAGTPDRTPKEEKEDERVAEVVSSDLLEMLDLQVISVEEDGSMTVRVHPHD